MSRRHKLMPAQAADLRAWAAQRMTLREKARSLGVSPETVRRYIIHAHKRREYA